MTLVGPRPALQYEVDLYSPQDRLRLLGKPGLTGPWQVYGRSRVSFPKSGATWILITCVNNLCGRI